MPARAKIEVGLEESMQVAAYLKLNARQLQECADATAQAGAHAQASAMYAVAATFDDFADKLYAPFLGDEQIASVSAHADQAAKERRG